MVVGPILQGSLAFPCLPNFLHCTHFSSGNRSIGNFSDFPFKKSCLSPVTMLHPIFHTVWTKNLPADVITQMTKLHSGRDPQYGRRWFYVLAQIAKRVNCKPGWKSPVQIPPCLWTQLVTLCKPLFFWPSFPSSPPPPPIDNVGLYFRIIMIYKWSMGKYIECKKMLTNWNPGRIHGLNGWNEKWSWGSRMGVCGVPFSREGTAESSPHTWLLKNSHCTELEGKKVLTRLMPQPENWQDSRAEPLWGDLFRK